MSQHMPELVLDLGTSKVAMAVVDVADDGEVLVQDLFVVPMRGMQRGVITDLEEVVASLRECERAAGSVGVRKEVTVSVNGGHIEGMNAQGFQPIFPPHRPIRSEDVLHVVNHSRQVTPTPDREQILALPREFRIDGQRGITRPVGMSGNRLEVLTHLVTGHIAHLYNVERALDAAGFKVRQMVPAPFASGLALLGKEERETGCVVIDLGAGTTGVSIFSQGALAGTACIPLGGNNVTADISKLLKMTPDEAEHLKREHGRAIPGTLKEDSTVEVRQIGQSSPRHLQRRVLYEIIEARMREIAVRVRDHLDRSGMLGTLPGGVLITGAGSSMPGIAQLFAKVLREPNVRISAPRMSGKAGLRASQPEFAGVCGLAVYALEDDFDAVEPASGLENWKERILTLFQSKV